MKLLDSAEQKNILLVTGLYLPDGNHAYEKLILLEYFLTLRNNLIFMSLMLLTSLTLRTCFNYKQEYYLVYYIYL